MRLRSRTTIVYVPRFIVFTALPFTVFRVMTKAGPDVSTSFVFAVTGRGVGVGGGGAVAPTVKEPRIVDACGSQLYLYVPFVSVTVQDSVVAAPTGVSRSTPGPVRWKLCSSDRS